MDTLKYKPVEYINKCSRIETIYEGEKNMEVVVINKKEQKQKTRIAKMIRAICAELCYACCDPLDPIHSLRDLALWYLELCEDYKKKFNENFYYKE